ncbi:MAG: hypothetical protein LBL73_07165, partial [Synergistaceae bacterium]|nr:hypothetical protein [Synergistaceae bacterium]
MAAGQNDFLPFAVSQDAIVLSQGQWEEGTLRTPGHRPGLASAALANKAERQGTVMAAALGRLIAESGGDALDNGDMDALVTALESMIARVSAGDIPDATETSKGVTQYANTAEALNQSVNDRAMTPQMVRRAITNLMGGSDYASLNRRVEVVEDNVGEIVLVLDGNNIYPGYSHMLLENFSPPDQIDSYSC